MKKKKMKKEPWLKKQTIKRRIREVIVDEVYSLIEDYQPQWADPWVSYSAKHDSLYISLTEEDSYDKYLPWGEFVENLLDHRCDRDTLKLFLPKLQKLCVDIEKVLKG